MASLRGAGGEGGDGCSARVSARGLGLGRVVRESESDLPHAPKRASAHEIPSSMASGVIRGAAVAVAGLGGGGLVVSEYMRRELGEDALPRMWRAYKVAIPAFLEYKRVQLLHEVLPPKFGRPPNTEQADAQYDALHDVWAPRMLEVVLDLRGFFIKSGQMLGSSFGDVSPPKWQKTFAPLLDAVPAKPFSEVRAIVEGELGRPLREVYASFDEAPLASASIGQVHRAVLPDGTRAVVKVMYPEAEAMFRGDVHTAKTFAQVAMPEHVPALSEIEKQFATEFDFRREAENLALVHANLAAQPAYADILIPAPITALCTKRVLTMTEIPHALKLTDALREDMSAHAQSQGVSLESLMEGERKLNEEALARGTLRCGPDAATMDRYISALRWRNAFGWLVGLPTLHVPRNHAALMDRLLEVHGHMALVDGAINGDPHPGNILLSRSSSSSASSSQERLALVDFGQVKRLSPEQRLAVSRLIVALARADQANPQHRAAVAGYIGAMGLKTDRSDPDTMFRMAQLFFDDDSKLVTGGKNVQAYIEALNQADATRSVGDDYVLVSRASLMLRGLGHLLNQHRSAARAWAPIAERVLAQAGEDPADVLQRAPRLR